MMENIKLLIGNAYNSTEELNESTIYTVEINKTEFYLNENLLFNFRNWGPSEITFTMPLFGQYYKSSNAINKCSSGTRVYYCKIWAEDETMQRDLVPCYRKEDNKPGLYDLVNNEFYTNLGTGEFRIGNEV